MTRDPRSQPIREATQSLSIDADADDADDNYDDALSNPSHPSLAQGTHEARDSNTKIESPAAHRRTPVPAESSSSRNRRTRPPPSAPKSSEDPRDYIGQVLGTYKVLELLGKGGMGYVFRAEHIKLGREVALKLLRPDYAKRKDAIARFFQEARTVNRMRHRNIVDVPDVVELDDGPTFIVMELLAGISLGKWARSGVDLPRALAVLVQICDGLGAAHAVGVIHRDLKPDNVMVVPTSDGAELVKLLDFGVAKLVNRDDEDVGFQTAAGSVIGTPAYMSPEQAGGMAIDHRSDIYSLGAIMYELFCGQPMFRGRSFGEYVRKHLTEMPVPPRQTEGGKDIDDRLEALILRCLEKEPGQRFQHILELRDGLLHMLGGYETAQHSLLRSSVRVNPLAMPLPPPQPSPSPGSVPSMPHMRVPTPIPANRTSQLHPSQIVQQSSVVTGPPHYTQRSQIVALPAPAPATPWWVWMFGGMVAVGLGIGGAWYVSRESATPTPPKIEPKPVPVVTPPLDPPPPTRPELVELRFDSLPAAGVFADGHSAELCRTPCSFDVDPKDGGDKRVFVVRAEGYRDMQVEVDLSDKKRDFSATLERIEPEPKPAVTPAPTKPGTRPVTKPVVRPSVTTTKPPEPKPDVTPSTAPAHVPDPNPNPGDPSKPIDTTTTHDPFHHHKP